MSMMQMKAQAVLADAGDNAKAIPVTSIISIILSLFSSLGLCGVPPAKGLEMVQKRQPLAVRRLSVLTRRELAREQRHLAPVVQESVLKVVDKTTPEEAQEMADEEAA